MKVVLSYHFLILICTPRKTSLLRAAGFLSINRRMITMEIKVFKCETCKEITVVETEFNSFIKECSECKMKRKSKNLRKLESLINSTIVKTLPK